MDPNVGSNMSTDLSHFATATIARCLTEDHGTLSAGGTTSINGQPAIVLRDAGDLPAPGPGRFSCHDRPPYPLRLNATGRQRPGGHIDVCNNGQASSQDGTLAFSHFNQISPLSTSTDPIKTPGFTDLLNAHPLSGP